MADLQNNTSHRKDEVESLYTQALEEMNSENFNCLWYYLTTWGENAK